MPATQNNGPRPACVEDFDHDKDTVVSETRVYARTSKDGSDSGYSSRTGTVDGDQQDPGRIGDLKRQGVQIERERMPYANVPAVRRRESIHQQKPSRPVAPEPVRAPKEEKKRFCHPKGVCWSCDKAGYHLTAEELDALKSRLRGEKAPAKEPPKPAREEPKPEIKERDDAGKLRRMSSHRDARPVMQYPPASMQPMAASYATPVGYYNSGYGTPIPPSGYTPQPPYPYGSYPQTPTTPLAPQYVAQPRQEYFPPSVPEIRPPQPKRASTYGDQDYDRMPRHYDEPVPSQRSYAPAREDLPLRSESRPATYTTSRNRDIADERYEEERRQMPPPQVPAKRSEPVRRPSTKKSYTYADSGHGRSSVDEPVDDHPAQNLQRRRSRHPDDYDRDATHALHSVRTRDDLPSPAPSSYRSDHKDLPSRPAPRQSVSYSDPHSTKIVAKGAPPQEATRRRVTEPLTPMDAKVAEAEAYQQKRNSVTSNPVPIEQMRSSKTSRAPSRSDAGSNYSASRDSTAARKARRGSMIIETSGKNRPLSIQMPDGTKISIGADEKEKEENRRQTKLLEQAPSSNSGVSHSTTSRSRATTTSHVSSDRSRDHEYQEKSSKRSSHVVESRPPASPVKTRSSRAPSRSRAGSDTSGSRNRRQSVVSERVIYRS
jgi:hypothetical protein